VAHGSVTQLLVLGTLTAFGTSLSFSAMPNLIIEAVPPEQTGQSTGINSVVRTVGAAVGSQITAVLLSTLVSRGTNQPTQAAIAAAFLVGAGTALVASAVTLWIPARGADGQDVLSYISSASSLPEPALSGEHR
jgi:MFS family permease